MSSTLKKLSSRLVLAQLSARVSTACWICTRTRTTPNGYARFWNQAKKKETVVHRTLYEELRGPIPEGLVLDHLCRVRLCVNPWHTEAVTVQLNTLRGGAALFGKMPATIRQWSPEADDYIIVQRQQGADWLAISQSLGVTRYQVIERYRKLRAQGRVVTKSPPPQLVLPVAREHPQALPAGHPLTWALLSGDKFPTSCS